MPFEKDTPKSSHFLCLFVSLFLLLRKGHVRVQQSDSHLQARKRVLTRTWACWHPQLRPPSLQDCEKIDVYCLSQPVYGMLLWQPQLTDTVDEKKSKQNQFPKGSLQFSSVQSLSRVQLFATSLSITNFRSSLRLTSIRSVMPSSHLILCHPLLLLPSIFPNIRDFSNESVLPITWPKYWSFSFSISPSNKYSGLISFRMDWFDLLAVQGTLSITKGTHFASFI